MRWTSVALLGLVVVGSGCGLLKKKGGDAADAAAAPEADAATVTVTGTGAANEAAVTRYEKETPLTNEEGVIAKDGVQVKSAVNTGTIVATLNAGTPVIKMAQYFSSGVLIMFDDPSTPEETKFMGWVPTTAFVAPPGTTVTATATFRPPAPTGTVKPQVPVVKVDAGTAPVAKVDAGVTPVAVVDAGAAPVAKVDAGATPTPPSNPQGGLAFPPPPSGKCPTPYQMLDGMCRRPCTNDSGCPRATKCVPARAIGHKYCSLG